MMALLVKSAKLFIFKMSNLMVYCQRNHEKLVIIQSENWQCVLWMHVQLRSVWQCLYLY